MHKCTRALEPTREGLERQVYFLGYLLIVKLDKVQVPTHPLRERARTFAMHAIAELGEKRPGETAELFCLNGCIALSLFDSYLTYVRGAYFRLNIDWAVYFRGAYSGIMESSSITSPFSEPASART